MGITAYVPARIRMVALVVAAAGSCAGLIGCTSTAPVVAATDGRTAAGSGVGRLVFQGVDPAGGDDNALFLADSRGNARTEILERVEGDLTHPDWSRDGRRIAFVVDGSSIRIAEAAGGRVEVAVGCAAGCVGVDYPAWSPDDRSIAYTRYDEAGSGGPPASSAIVVRDLRSGSERVVASSEPGQLVDVPRWSADGRRLAIGIDRFDPEGVESGSAIAVVDVAAGSSRVLTRFGDFAYAPDWDPLTDEIVFSHETLQYSSDPPSAARDLFGIRADGSHQRRITSLDDGSMAWQPAFAPDGRSIVATLDEPGGRRGVRIDPRTGDLERLGGATSIMTHLKVRPEPHR